MNGVKKKLDFITLIMALEKGEIDNFSKKEIQETIVNSRGERIHQIISTIAFISREKYTEKFISAINEIEASKIKNETIRIICLFFKKIKETKRKRHYLIF